MPVAKLCIKYIELIKRGPLRQLPPKLGNAQVRAFCHYRNSQILEVLFRDDRLIIILFILVNILE